VVVRFEPFHCTTELVLKPLPYTYIVLLLLLMMKLDGLVFVITGVAVAVAIVKNAVGDVLAAGAGFTAVMFNRPVALASEASSTNVSCVGVT
jgi:hypothetical protein